MRTYLFGGALAGSTSAYLQEVLPGIFVQTVVMITMYTGLTLSRDIEEGVFDRFRSLPVWWPCDAGRAAAGRRRPLRPRRDGDSGPRAGARLQTAGRGLMHGRPVGEDVVVVLLMSAALVAIFGPLTMRRYNRRT